MSTHKRKIIYIFKILCSAYALIIGGCFVLLGIVHFGFGETFFYSVTGCELLEPSPFPSISCNDTVFGRLTEFFFNLPVSFAVVSIFGIFSIKGLAYLLMYWAPILFLFSLNWRHKRDRAKSGN